MHDDSSGAHAPVPRALETMLREDAGGGLGDFARRDARQRDAAVRRGLVEIARERREDLALESHAEAPRVAGQQRAYRDGDDLHVARLPARAAVSTRWRRASSAASSRRPPAVIR